MNKTLVLNKKDDFSIAIVGCLHGDEIAGKKVINIIKKMRPIVGNISYFIANDKALKKRKRFIKQDLNRSFPGKRRGNTEEKIAHVLSRKLKKFDIVLDLHATNSNIKNLAIVTNLNKETRKLLKFVPSREIAIVSKKVFGGKEMIRHCNTGVSLEYGPNKSGKNYRRILNDVKTILFNLGVLKGKKKIFPKKILYRVSGTYQVSKNFKQKKDLKDFHFIKRGQIIGEVSGKQIKSSIDFYPLFLGKGRYEKTLALISRKKELLKV